MSPEGRSDPAPRDAPTFAAPASDEAAWTEVRAAWSDEAAHRRYLARFQSLEALAVAGNRYKAVLAERPDDAMALRMRAEIVKKATLLGLASLPRERPPLARLKPGWTILALAIWIILAALFFWTRNRP